MQNNGKIIIDNAVSPKVGGIVGFVNSSAPSTIKNTYNIGAVQGTGAGGIIGNSSNPSTFNVISSYFSKGNDNGYGILKTDI